MRAILGCILTREGASGKSKRRETLQVLET
jgi:hypothetical protein